MDQIRREIKARMERLGYSQTRLAERAGIPRSRLGKYLAGGHPLTLEQFWKVLGALRIRGRVEAEILRALRD